MTFAEECLAARREIYEAREAVRAAELILPLGYQLR